MVNGKTMKVSNDFVKLIEEVKTSERKRGNICSNPTATRMISFDYTNKFKNNHLSSLIKGKDNLFFDSNIKIININFYKSIKKIDAEHYATGFFKEKGFKVFFSSNKKIFNEIPSRFEEIISSLKDKNGRPDLFIFCGDNYYFVEVKNSNDYLRENQLNWVIRNPKVNFIIFYLNQK